jgi:hypothetical protein
MAVKASYGMGFPMHHKMSIQRHKVSSPPFPPPQVVTMRCRLYWLTNRALEYMSRP